MLKELGIANPYRGLDKSRLEPDLQGWASDHRYFHDLVSRLAPKQIIEVGTWKGASAVRMAHRARSIDPKVTVLCVDTWLGSNQVLWSDPKLRPLLQLDENGYPSVYKQFLSNIVHEGLQNTVFPLPMTSSAAAELLAHYKVRADLIYIDAGHAEYEVYGDLQDYWQLLRPGGIMFGDDYWTSWIGVVKAVNRFAYEKSLPLEISEGKWFVIKPEEDR
jgi:hypothetical protein